jgi:hypothetical protein
MTATALAKAAGIPRTSLDRMLNGRGQIKPAYWWLVFDALEVDMQKAIIRTLDQD